MAMDEHVSYIRMLDITIEQKSKAADNETDRE